MTNKKGFEFSFGWIFAIIVGAVIIFLAIYAATRIVGQNKSKDQGIISQQLGIILSSAETGSEDVLSIRPIEMPALSRITFECATEGSFGSQKIKVQTKSDVGEKWSDYGIFATFYNKYIFASTISEGKRYYVFSKPFNYPFKVADLLYVISDKQKYCFIDPPGVVEDEMDNLISLKSVINITTLEYANKCPKDSIRTCFRSTSSTGCDIDIDLNSKTVRKKNKPVVYYTALDESDYSLMYAALFSDDKTYNCQLVRLMKRANELAILYSAKTAFLSPKGCSSNLEEKLGMYRDKIKDYRNSASIIRITMDARGIRDENDLLRCKLF